MKKILATLAIAASIGAANAATVTVCSDDGSECYMKKGVQAAGTFENPIVDQYGYGDYRYPVHQGMYCSAGNWHRGYLRPWEHSPVIKPSCGRIV